MTDPKSRVDSLMSDLPDPKSKHVLASNPDLVQAITYTLEKVKSGQLPMGLRQFYETKLKAEFGGPTWPSVRAYCRDVLRLDTQTGKSL